MSDINKMNISLLKSYHQDFSNEKENFNQSSFQTFSSSYLKNCSDPYVLKMSDSLNRMYLKIKNGYANIDNWWVDYNENLEGLENALSNDTKSGSISESLLRNYINTQLPELRNYNLKLAGIISPVVVGAVKSPKFINDKVVSSVDPFANLYREYDDDKSVDNFVSKINEYDGKVFEQVNSKVTTVKENVSSKVTEVVDVETTSFKQTRTYVADESESIWNIATDWVSNAASTVGDFFSDVGTTIADGAKSLWADVTNWWDGVVDWWNEDALPWIENAANAVWDTLKRVGATIAVFVQSLVEGLLQFVEAIVDFVAIVGTGVASIFTGLYDGYQAIRGAITGEEWSSATVAMWEKGTMAFVSNQYVTGWFDALYQNTGYGNWLMDNAYGFDTVRSIGSGIGYIAGVVLLTVATFGAGSVVAAGGTVTASTAVAATTSTQMAIIATAAGVGKGTETAWSEGASLLEGLSVGTLTGLWEGFQFYIGGKIGMTSLFGKNGIFKAIGGSGIGTKILNGFARVVLDGVDGGLEGFVQPALQSIYKDGYYDENGQYVEFSNEYNILERYVELFNDSGGWKNVGIQATIGSASSLLGEVFDLNKYFKSSHDSKNVQVKPSTYVTEQDIALKISRYNELLNIKNSKEYIDYMDYAKKGYAQRLRPEFEGIESEIMSLETEIKGFMGANNLSKSIPSSEIARISNDSIDNYLANLQEFTSKGILLEDYLKQNGVDVKRLNSHMELAECFGDSKLYLFGKLKQLAESNILNNSNKKEILDIYGRYKSIPVADIDAKKLMSEFKKYLSSDEIKVYNELLKSGLSDNVLKKYSQEQLDAVFNYTACGGFEINGWLNDAKINGKRVRDSYSSIEQIQNIMSGHGRNRIFTSKQGNIIDTLDSVISSAKYDDTIITYRGVKELFDFNNKIDINNLEVGDSFSSYGYQSSSILLENSYGFTKADTNVILEILVPPKSGVGAYIENITGCLNYCQTEFIIKRNAVMTVIDKPYKTIINGVEKTIIPVVVQ